MQLRRSSHASSSCRTSCSTSAVLCCSWRQLSSTASRRRRPSCSKSESSSTSSGFQLTIEAISGQLHRCVEGVEAYRWLRGYSMDTNVTDAQAWPDLEPADSLRLKPALDDRSLADAKGRLRRDIMAEVDDFLRTSESLSLSDWGKLVFGDDFDVYASPDGAAGGETGTSGICIFEPWRDAGFGLRATSALGPAATILVTTPIAGLPPSAADPGPTSLEAAYALKKAGATVKLHVDGEGQTLVQADAQEDEHAVEAQQERGDADTDGIWWDEDQWYSYLDFYVEFWGSLEQLTDGKPMSKVAVAALAWQLRTKLLAGNLRARVWGLHMHDGEHWQQQPRLQAAYCPFPPDLAALATDAPPLPGAAHLAAITAYTQECALQLYGAADVAKECGTQDVQEAQYALQRCRNPADRWRALPYENSVVGENAFVLQQDPWLAAVAAHHHQHQQQQQQQQQQGQAQQQQGEALPAVVQGVWPELGMIPHSCTPNTTAAVMHKSAVLLNAGSHGIPEGAPLTCNLLGRDTFLPIRLRRAAVKKLGGVMAYGDCSCERCRLEGGLPAELQQQMMEAQLFYKSISSAAHPDASSAIGSTDSSGGTALQQQRQQLAAHLQAVEAALAKLQLGQQQQLWLQASMLNLYELAAEAAAAAGEAPPLLVLETLVAAAAEAAPGSATHLHWAQQYAAVAAAAADANSSSIKAEQQRLAAYHLRYGSSLSMELYALLAVLPVAKPVRQVACAEWDWGHNYSPATGSDLNMDGYKDPRAASDEDEDVYTPYFGNSEDGDCRGLELVRRMHVEL